MRNTRDRYKKRLAMGISLIEVLLAIAIFTLAVATLGTMSLSGMTAIQSAVTRERANLSADEGLAAIRSIRALASSLLTPGTYGISFAGGSWSLVPTATTDDGLTRTVTITSVGAKRFLADINVTWTRDGAVQSATRRSGFIDLYRGSGWIQTTVADFSSGKRNGSEVLSAGDGAVGLELKKDWGRPKEFATVDPSGLGTVSAMTESGDVLYAALWGGGESSVSAVDTADAGDEQLVSLASATRPERVNALAISGRYLILGTDGDSSELVVLKRNDLSLVSTVDLPGTADVLSLVATGTTVYAGRSRGSSPEVYELNATDPSLGLPVVRSKDVTTDVAAMALGATTLFLGGTSDTSEVIALRRSDLETLASTDLPGTANITSAVLSGATLAVGRVNSSAQEFAQIDASNPAIGLPTIGGIDLADGLVGLSLGSDGKIYGAENQADSELVTIDPATLTARSFDITQGAGGSAILAVNGYVYVGLQNNNPEIVALKGGNGQWENPTITGSFDASGNSDGASLAVSGTRAYLGTANSSGPEFLVLDVANPKAIAQTGTLEIGSDVNGISPVSSSILALATGNNASELRIVSVANPTTPTTLGIFNISGNTDAFAIAASGTLVALGTNNNGSGRELYLFDVANPASPRLLSSIELGAAVHGLAFTTGGYLVAATENNAKELVVYDTRAGTLTEASSYNTAGSANGLGVRVSGNIIHFITENSGAGADYYVFLFNPTNGTVGLAGSLDLSATGNDIAIVGDMIFIPTTNPANLIVIDGTTPSLPRILSTTAIADSGIAAAGTQGRFYSATAENSREIVILEPNPPLAEYLHRGTFTSAPFDSGNAGTVWSNIAWTLSGTGTALFQIRTSATRPGLSRALWTGQGGNVDTSYTDSGDAIIPDPQADGTRWIEWRGILQGNGVAYPVLDDVTISYN